MAIIISDEQLRKLKGQPEPKKEEPIVIEEKPKKKRKQYEDFSFQPIQETGSGADY